MYSLRPRSRAMLSRLPPQLLHFIPSVSSCYSAAAAAAAAASPITFSSQHTPHRHSPFPSSFLSPSASIPSVVIKQQQQLSGRSLVFSLSSSSRGFASCPEMGDESVTYLSQREAAEIDEILMGPLGFSVDQLMELAGLSVAASIAEVYKSSEYSRILVICGPGNNGGDGLVAARHLYHFGYKPLVCYPKRTAKALYTGLVTQLESLAIPFLSAEDLPQILSDDFDLIVDAIFGFSFHGSPRPPFDDLIQRLVSLHGVDNAPKRKPAIISVDIPSGWHVEEGDVNGDGIKPDMLVSLTAPKLCAKKFSGPHHFLGGRFVPPSIKDKFGLKLPPYPGTSMCVRIGKPPSVDISSLRENYVSPELREDQVMADPIDQFQKWFDEAVGAGLREPNAMALSTCGKDGKLSSRIVLLKGVDKEGFVWYTNYGSRKARDLSENPHASLLFHWNHLNRQVRVEGTVQKVSDEESERYFHSRPRGSQLGAIVSKQSTPIAGRHVLQQAYMELEMRYSDGKSRSISNSSHRREKKHHQKGSNNSSRRRRGEEVENQKKKGKKIQFCTCSLPEFAVLGESHRRSRCSRMLVYTREDSRKVWRSLLAHWNSQEACRRSEMLIEGQRCSLVLGKTRERSGEACWHSKIVGEARHCSGMLVGSHGCLAVIADHCSPSFFLSHSQLVATSPLSMEKI